MKKTLPALFLILTALLVVPSFVSADVGGPLIPETDCTVINPDGALYYVWIDTSFAPAQDRVPYGTVLSITGEVFIPDFMESENFSGRVGTAIYQDKFIYVDMQDFAVIDQTDPLGNAVPLAKKTMMKVIAPEGVAMYAGPSPVYEQTDVIPYDANITFIYGDTYSDLSACSYGYGEWNGRKGWIMVFDLSSKPVLAERVTADSVYAGVAAVYDENVCLVDLSQYAGEKEAYEKLTDPVPAGTVLSFDFYFTGYYGSYALVNYNGVDGFLPLTSSSWQYPQQYTDVYTGVLVYNRDQYMILRNDSMLYADAGDRDSALDITVPVDTILRIEATYLENAFDENLCHIWNLVSYQGQKGFVLRENVNVYEQETFSDTLYQLDYYDDFKIYEKPDRNSSVIAECRTADDLYAIYSVVDPSDYTSYYFVVGPDYTGWACDGVFFGDPVGSGAVALLASVFAVEPMPADDLLPEDPLPEEEPQIEEEDAAESETKDPDQVSDLFIPPEDVPPLDVSGTVRSTRDTVILVICAAVIGAVTAIAVICLLRKKE